MSRSNPWKLDLCSVRQAEAELQREKNAIRAICCKLLEVDDRQVA